MANSFNTLVEEAYSAGIQLVLRKILVAEKICGKEAQAALAAGGDVYHKPYIPRGISQSYTEGTGVTKQDFTGTDEYLSLTTKTVYNFHLDYTDMRQQKRRAAILAHMTANAMEELQTVVDGDFFYRYQDADYEYGSAGLRAKTSTSGFTLSVSNCLTSFGTVMAHLLNHTGGIKSKFLVVDPYHMDTIENSAIGNLFNVADSTFKNGYVGNFKGYKLYVSNNLTSEVTFTFNSSPTATDTIVINGTTLTFVATLTDDGQLHICGSTTYDAINLAAALNAPGTDITEATNTGYDAVTSTADLHNLSGMVATNSTNVVTIKCKRGRMSLSETMTDTSSVFSTQVVHALAGEEGSIELALQENGKVFVNDAPVDASGNTLLEKEFNVLSMYGIKTFDDGDARLVDVQINC